MRTNSSAILNIMERSYGHDHCAQAEEIWTTAIRWRKRFHVPAAVVFTRGQPVPPANAPPPRWQRRGFFLCATPTRAGLSFDTYQINFSSIGRGPIHAGLRGAKAAQSWAQLASAFYLDWHHRDVLFALIGERCALPLKRQFGARTANRMATSLRYEDCHLSRVVERKRTEGLGYASQGLLPVKPEVTNLRYGLFGSTSAPSTFYLALAAPNRRGFFFYRALPN